MSGRPPKNTVDYFPHDANASNGKTLFILQSRFGNNGYAGWFKILELLARTPGHTFSFESKANWQFLVAIMAFPVPEIELFLSCLAELSAIDPDLYLRKILWSDNFITRIACVYSERKAQIPIKPPINAISPPINSHVNQFLVPEIHILNESKGNEIKLNNIPLPPSGGIPPIKTAVAAYKKVSLKPVQVLFDLEADTPFIDELRVIAPLISSAAPQIHTEFLKCRDYYELKGGVKNPRLALKNWFANAEKYKKERKNGSGLPTKSKGSGYTGL